LQKRSTDNLWLPPGLAVKMWRAGESGRPHIPEGDPKPIPYKPLWGEVEINPAKRKAEKKVLRASESIEKKSFIINGIAKYIQYWRHGKECEVCRGDVMLC
jgi:hypothetical protein